MRRSSSRRSRCTSRRPQGGGDGEPRGDREGASVASAVAFAVRSKVPGASLAEPAMSTTWGGDPGGSRVHAVGMALRRAVAATFPGQRRARRYDGSRMPTGAAPSPAEAVEVPVPPFFPSPTADSTARLCLLHWMNPTCPQLFHILRLRLRNRPEQTRAIVTRGLCGICGGDQAGSAQNGHPRTQLGHSRLPERVHLGHEERSQLHVDVTLQAPPMPRQAQNSATTAFRKFTPRVALTGCPRPCYDCSVRLRKRAESRCLHSIMHKTYTARLTGLEGNRSCRHPSRLSSWSTSETRTMSARLLLQTESARPGALRDNPTCTYS
jgi:hypothetical protein